ncbi:DUF3549 family protein [Halomonas sp.]|jgi:hypothetical protein|uniref:DUF3549 family protein n=1 Tax=Halomonas sp. TaxID=1486246 RepID=UPI00356A52BE
MRPIHSLHDFFLRSGSEVRLYHLGRGVEPCALDTLAAFEAGHLAWPYPWRGEARLGMVFRLANSADPLIWFLALPLDESGQLVPGPRDAFIERLLTTLGQSAEAMASESGPRVDNLMKDNPLTFTPSLPFQAVMHARATRDLGLPASQHLELVEAYLSGQQHVDWQALGLQGVADFVVRLDDDASRSLSRNLATLPDEVLTSLCYCLEHVAIDDALALALRQRGEYAAARGDIETFCACVRSMAGASTKVAGAWLDTLLADPNACGPDLLAAVAGRGWRHLEDADRLPRFLDRLAEQPDVDFTVLARDLALIPRLRLPVLMTLREAVPDSLIGRRLSGLSR